ncbi:hypothetical protein GWI33_020103 [Rhynchophorus ferrugineus]|uniref:Uncharacterized protein n=1 Tax=Rhynchophorus ferrugineus TaxID=354439 RepID=A0A834HQ49_RHYFE|nr:hypothetical protein GWI33_020103 [Rhynchophorus ferrugineus]
MLYVFNKRNWLVSDKTPVGSFLCIPDSNLKKIHSPFPTPTAQIQLASHRQFQSERLKPPPPQPHSMEGPLSVPPTYSPPMLPPLATESLLLNQTAPILTQFGGENWDVADNSAPNANGRVCGDVCKVDTMRDPRWRINVNVVDARWCDERGFLKIIQLENYPKHIQTSQLILGCVSPL